MISPTNAISFMNIVGKLKIIKRTGWVRNGIYLPESISDHMYRMSMMSWMISDPTINRDKLIKMCLVHDLAESVVGDITPHCKVSIEEKKVLEENAFRKIIQELEPLEVGQEILSLWLEFENGTSVEANVARQFDKLEMIIQADEYEKQQNVVLQDFFDSTANYFTQPEILSWANELRTKRDIRLQSTASKISSDGESI